MLPPIAKQAIALSLVAVLALSQTACKKEVKIEIKIEIKIGGVKAPLLDTTDTDSGVDKGTAMQSISSASCADYAYIADADKFYFSPDSDYVPKATLTIVTDTGTTSSLQFDLVRDSALSAQYTPAGSTTAVHAYVAKNCQQVKDFGLAAIGQANSTVTITAETKVRFVDNSSPEGSYAFYSRQDTPSTLQTLGSASYFSEGPSGGDDCPGGRCPIQE